MWTYSQSTGNLTDRFGSVLGQGYSGNGSDLNNPAAEGVIGHGPIPQGAWEIGPFSDHPVLGPISAPLTPAPSNDMDGRDGGFYIHGDNAQMNHTASDGCIILSRPLRQSIADSGDTSLQVVA
jgi:hypothetical protein